MNTKLHPPWLNGSTGRSTHTHIKMEDIVGVGQGHYFVNANFDDVTWRNKCTVEWAAHKNILKGAGHEGKKSEKHSNYSPCIVSEEKLLSSNSSAEAVSKKQNRPKWNPTDIPLVAGNLPGRLRCQRAGGYASIRLNQETEFNLIKEQVSN